MATRRKGNKREDDTPNKRGRGTKKTPVIGIVERAGRVVVGEGARSRQEERMLTTSRLAP